MRQRANCGRRCLPHPAEQEIGLGRVQLQHLALEVAFAVRHAREMSTIDRRLAGRQGRRRHCCVERYIEFRAGVFFR
jgi:hypothetical protein